MRGGPAQPAGQEAPQDNRPAGVAPGPRAQTAVRSAEPRTPRIPEPRQQSLLRTQHTASAAPPARSLPRACVPECWTLNRAVNG